MEKEQMKKAILSRIRNYPGTSYAELSRVIPGFNGDRLYVSDKDSNIVFWAGMSAIACDAIRELQKDKKIRMHEATRLVYWGDQSALILPVVVKPPKSGYKKLHWLPTVLYLTRKEIHNNA